MEDSLDFIPFASCRLIGQLFCSSKRQLVDEDDPPIHLRAVGSSNSKPLAGYGTDILTMDTASWPSAGFPQRVEYGWSRV